MEHEPEVMLRALGEFGLPAFLKPGELRFDASKDLAELSLEMTLEIAGLANLAVSVPLVEKGEFVDPRVAVRKSVESQLQRQLGEKVGGLSLGRDTGVSVGPIRLEIMPGTFVPRLDWVGGTLSAAATLSLNVGETYSIAARAELALDRRGARVREIAFEPFDQEALVAAIIAIEPFQRLAALGDSWEGSIVPELIDRELAFTVHARPILAGCALPVEHRIRLASPGSDLDALVEKVGDVALSLALCQARAKALDGGLDRLLEGGKVELFGLAAAFEPDRAEALEAITAGGGRVSGTLRIELDESVCASPPPPWESDGVAFVVDVPDDTYEVDFSALERPERKSLGEAVKCVLNPVLAPVAAYVSVREVEVGQRVLAVDLTVRNLPWIGEISLDRVNVLSPDRSIEALVRGALTEAATQKLGQRIAEAIGEEVELGGVGTFRPNPNGVRLNLDGDSPELTLEGGLRFADYDLDARVRLPLDPSALSDIDIEILEDLESAIGGRLVEAAIDYLPFASSEIVKFKTPPRFVRLDDHGRRWGVVFGLELNFALGNQGIKVGIDRVAISQSGVDLPAEIRAAPRVHITFGAAAMSRVLIAYHTGQGSKAGLVIGADLTVAEPSLADVLKLEATLDLRNLDQLRFELEGEVVAFGTVPLLDASGLVDLRRAVVAFEVETNETIEDVIELAVEGRLDGANELMLASSDIGLLGVDLQQTEARFCTRESPASDRTGAEPDLACPDGGSIHLVVDQELPFTRGFKLRAASDLRFQEPAFGAGVQLNLFGWEPGGARFDADTARANAALSFLGFNVSVTTPTVALLTPGVIADVLRSLLDIDLEDLLKLDPKDIRVVLMKRDGSVEGPPPKGGGGVDGGGGDEESAPPPKWTDLPPEVGPSPPTPGGHTRWGQAVDFHLCMKISGSPTREVEPNDRFQIWSWLKGPGEVPEEAVWNAFTSQLVGEEAVSDAMTFGPETARAVCQFDAGSPKVRPTLAMVGARRTWGPYTPPECDDGVPRFSLWALKGDDEAVRARFLNARRPVLCWAIPERSPARSDDVTLARVQLLIPPTIDAQIWLDGTAPARYLALLFCAPGASDSAPSATNGLYDATCARDEVIDLGAPPGDPQGLIDVSTETALFDRRLRPLLTGENAEDIAAPVASFEIEADGVSATVFPSHATAVDAGRSRRWDVWLPRSADPTLTEVRPLTLRRPAAGRRTLWDWMDRPVFREEILSRWVEARRRPRLAEGWHGEQALVLELTRDGVRETLLWLEEDGAGGLRRRTVDVPLGPPGGGGRFTGTERERWMEALWHEIRMLPEPERWRVTLGLAEKSEIALHAYRAHAPSDDRLRVVLHGSRPSSPAQGIWSGADGPLARRVCGSREALARALAEAGPDRGGKTLEREELVRRALSDPDDYFEALGPQVNPLAAILRLGECPAR